jgi:hypothetical protein
MLRPLLSTTHDERPRMNRTGSLLLFLYVPFIFLHSPPCTGSVCIRCGRQRRPPMRWRMGPISPRYGTGSGTRMFPPPAFTTPVTTSLRRAPRFGSDMRSCPHKPRAATRALCGQLRMESGLPANCETGEDCIPWTHPEQQAWSETMDDFTTAEIQTGETTIFARWSGSGPPLLLLHGFPHRPM